MRIFRRRRKRAHRAYGCRGLIGHRWRYLPAWTAEGANIIAGSPSVLRCKRCGTSAPFGMVRQFRRALDLFRTFTDEGPPEALAS